MKSFLDTESSIQFVLFCVFCLALLILLWYYVYYFSQLAFHVQKKATPESFPPASVILCARNEDRNLSEFLPFILSQEYPEYEVVVVNDCSWDNTAEVLGEFEKKYAHLKVITVKEDNKHRHGKKFAVMVGIKGATHEHLLFTDGDCKPAGNQWLKKMIRGFSGKEEGVTHETEIVLGYSKYEKLPGLLNSFIRFDTFHIALQYLSFAIAGVPYMGVGRNLAYKKSLFFKHKGFSTHYHIESGDDDLFINKTANPTNTQIEISPESFTVSRAKKSWADWIEQKRRHLTTWKEYKTPDKIRLGVYSFMQGAFWVLFIILVIFQYEIYILFSLVVLKLVTQFIIFKLAMNKLGEKDLLVLSLLAELFLIVFYLTLAISNKLFQQKIWKRV